MNDLLDISRRGFRQKLGTYLVMTLLVAFTVAGYLTISSYWRDATAVSTAATESLDFPYLKATTLFAYWSNPPTSPDEEFPPPRRYAPVYNDAHLMEIARIPGVLDLSVALEQTAFSRFGNSSLLSIEPNAGLWQGLRLVSGRLPVDASEVLIPEPFAQKAQLGHTLTVKVADNVMPRTYRVDSVLAFKSDPVPEKTLTVVGVYEPRSMISGLIGFLPVNRVSEYSESAPKKVEMSWPTPNTIFLHLENPAAAANVSSSWNAMYLDYPGADPPLIPPAKVEWHPSAAEDAMRMATTEVAAPLYANTLNAFALGAIGIFAAMFVSFLDRRKELGIMKTVGIDNAHTAGAVSMEVVFSGVFGTVLGVGAAEIVVNYCIKGVAGGTVSIPAAGILTGAAAAGLVLAAATYIPRAMARQGTVMELLYGRPIPILRKRR